MESKGFATIYIHTTYSMVFEKEDLFLGYKVLSGMLHLEAINLSIHDHI